MPETAIDKQVAHALIDKLARAVLALYDANPSTFPFLADVEALRELL